MTKKEAPQCPCRHTATCIPSTPRYDTNMRSYSEWHARIRNGLRRAREQAGISQAQAGHAPGLTSVAYGNFERGTSPISIEHLFAFSPATGQPVSLILTLDTPLTDDEDDLPEQYRRSPNDMWKRLVLQTVERLIQASTHLPPDSAPDEPPAPGEPE